MGRVEFVGPIGPRFVQGLEFVVFWVRVKGLWFRRFRASGFGEFGI